MTRTRDCDMRIEEGRLRKAEQFLYAAEVIDTVLDRDDDRDVSDAFVTLCVHAGIAASDVICCVALGRYAQGDDHAKAVDLLKRVDNAAGNDLRRLLNVKNKASYTERRVSNAERKRAGRTARALVEAAQRLSGAQ